MEYPEVLAEQAAATETREAEEESQESRSDASSSSASQSITVTDSDTSSSVAEKLYDAGLISSASDLKSIYQTKVSPIPFSRAPSRYHQALLKKISWTL